MRGILLRLRAALTPQALLLLFAILLLALGFMGKETESSSPLERRIEQTLSSVRGAGRVRVVIKEQTLYSAGTLSSSKEQTVISGAVAVASGAHDPLVKLEIQEALCALLDLPPSAVSVMTGGE